MRLKPFVLAGASAGAALAIVIALLMDTLYPDSMGGSWRQAIAGDFSTFFSIRTTPESLLVTAVFLLILMALGVFGAAVGLVFSLFAYKFFGLLLRK